MRIDDGGPAFSGKSQEKCSNPNHTPECTEPVEYKGMSLRDYYAGQAMQGILANPHKWIVNGKNLKEFEDSETPITGVAYKLADSMIARKRETEKADA